MTSFTTIHSRFPDGYTAEETLELLRLAWTLGSPAIAAHCGSQIFQRDAGSIVSSADVDVESWHVAAQHLKDRAVFHPGVGATLRKDLVPVACWTDRDVQVLLEAEEILAMEVLSEQIDVSAVADFDRAASIARAQRRLAARIVPETLEWNNLLQSRRGTTLTGCWYTATSMPKLGPKRTPASSGNQIGPLPSNEPSTVTSSSNQDAKQCAVCMTAPVQAGFLHG